ncbi:MAG TPA: hypothetical protein VFA44_00970 [Gaiellaceae bacterium]|nr:hypothetical protein [Gaiellaceae bacterium]
MSKMFSVWHSMRTRPPGRSSWMIGGAALVALAVWVPLALAAPKRASAVAPVNVEPPGVVGTAQEGQVLTANPGKWQGTRPMTFSFQWQACDANGCADVGMMKATDRILAVPGSAVGKAIRVVVTASNPAGSASMPSQPTDAAVAAPATNPRNTQLPLIYGTVREGEMLVAQPGRWLAPGPIRFLYRWRTCRASGGACAWTNVTARTYSLKASDVGHSFRVLVRATVVNGGGLTPLRWSAALSDPTAAVGPLRAPINTSAPTITGKAQVGELLTAHPGTWRGAQPITFKYQWVRCDDKGANCIVLTGATQSQFELGDRDAGHRMRVLVTAVNRAGRTEVMSGSTDVVKTKPVPGPANTQTPTISGAAVVGATLTADPGKWQSQGPITITYQWVRCDANVKSCPPIAGATKNTYTLTSTDVGHRLIVQVTARNAGGTSVASSSPTAVVQGNQPPPPPSTKGTMSISQVSLPDRLVVDRLQFSPSRITSTSQPLIARFHVSETQNGRSVQGALVYATGVPYNRLSNAPEAATGSDGWATITFRILPTFELRPGNLVVLFVRARKPGENLLAGVSNRRLVSVQIG